MKKALHTSFAITAFLLLAVSSVHGQTAYTIGTDDGTNGAMSYPTPFGDYYKTMRTQHLYLASELTAAGMTAGFISEIAWTVDILPATTGETENYTIKLLSTATTSLDITSFEPGAAVVWGPVTYTPVLGVNNFTLDLPFFWDGASNLIVEICGGDPAGTFTKCARVKWSGPFAFNASHTFRSDTETNICDYSGIENFDYSPGGQDYRPQVIFTTTPATECTTLGTISPAVSTLSSVCVGEPITVSIDPIIELGITYQWSRSFDAVTWANIPGASASIYTTTQTTPTYYRCKVVCTPSGTLGFSANVFVDQNDPLDCYCVPTYTFGTTEGDYVSNVHLGAISNPTGASLAPYYTYYPALTATLNPGAPYTVSITAGSYATNNGLAAWIDYNEDGFFDDATEKLGEVTGLAAFGTANIVFTPPLATVIGTTRMRVRDIWNTPGMTACGEGGYGETEDYNINFTPGIPPTAAFSFTGDPVVAFTDLSTDAPTSWYWNFGDGGTSPVENPTHTYTTNGTYNACLTATNYFGSSTLCQSVVIDSYMPPVSAFSYTGDPTVAFTDLSTHTPTSWAWNFGDGGTSTLQNPVHTYAANGTYNVCLTATNALGSNISCQNVVIDSYLAPVASFTYSGDPTVTFDDNSTNSPTSWFWYFGDGATSTLENPVHTYAENGIYNVCLTATNATGSNTSCQNVTIDSYLAPLANFSYTGDPTVSFTDLSTNSPSSWTWDFGDGGTSVLENPTHTYATNGTYTVCLTATNLVGSNTVCHDVVIDSYVYTPVAAFSYAGDPIVTFTDLSTNAPTTWAWDFGDGGTSALQNPVHNYTVNGTYNVCLTASNIAGSDNACNTIIISGHPAPVALFSYIGDPDVNFTDLSTNSPTSWLWNFGDGGISTAENPTHAFTTNGTFNVCLSVVGPGGTDNYCADVLIEGNGFAPAADFTYSVTGLTVSFTDISTNAPNDWLWQFGDGAISGLQNPTHTYAVDGIYNVCLTATNIIGSDDKCEDITAGQVAIADLNEGMLIIYPNPAFDLVSISCDKPINSGSDIRILNTSGQQVSGWSVIDQDGNTAITIRTSTLPAGTYMIKITSDTGTYIGKVIKL